MNFYETEQFSNGNLFKEITTCDNIFEQFMSILREYQAEVTLIQGFCEGADEQIKVAFAEIANDLHSRLMALCQHICNTKTQIQRDALKHKTEIFNLTKENKQLQEQILRLSLQVQKMEAQIGKNFPISYMSLTK